MGYDMGKTIKKLAIGGLIAASATGAMAATQGTTGFISTGDLFITLTVNDEVKISNLADINLGVFAGVDAVGTSPACIYRNTGSAYSLTATGSGAGNAFELTDPGATTSVAYTVAYDDASGFSGMATGVALNSTGAAGADNDCATNPGGDNGLVQVTVSAAAGAALPALVYTGTLTLVVAPI